MKSFLSKLELPSEQTCNPAPQSSPSHNAVFMRVQQLATLAVHKRFFVRDHVLPIAIRFEECFCSGDVIEPNLRDTVKVGGCCPW